MPRREVERTISVLLADDHLLVRRGFRRLLEDDALGERLGTENVGAHHGSLSRMLRLDAERRLKRGEIKILVATASLELGAVRSEPDES